MPPHHPSISSSYSSTPSHSSDSITPTSSFLPPLNISPSVSSSPPLTSGSHLASSIGLISSRAPTPAAATNNAGAARPPSGSITARPPSTSRAPSDGGLSSSSSTVRSRPSSARVASVPVSFEAAPSFPSLLDSMPQQFIHNPARRALLAAPHWRKILVSIVECKRPRKLDRRVDTEKWEEWSSKQWKEWRESKQKEKAKTNNNDKRAQEKQKSSSDRRDKQHDKRRATRALHHYAEMWERKLNSYRAALEDGERKEKKDGEVEYRDEARRDSEDESDEGDTRDHKHNHVERSPDKKSNRPPLFTRAIQGIKARRAYFALMDTSEMKLVFDELARDGYSKITRASFRSSLGGEGYRDAFADRLWAAINSRQSNFLDMYDFQQALAIAIHANNDDKASFAFEIYDFNDDGVICQRDLFTAMSLGLDDLLSDDFNTLNRAMAHKMEEAKERMGPLYHFELTPSEKASLVHITKAEWLKLCSSRLVEAVELLPKLFYAPFRRGSTRNTIQQSESEKFVVPPFRASLSGTAPLSSPVNLNLLSAPKKMGASTSSLAISQSNSTSSLLAEKDKEKDKDTSKDSQKSAKFNRRSLTSDDMRNLNVAVSIASKEKEKDRDFRSKPRDVLDELAFASVSSNSSVASNSTAPSSAYIQASPSTFQVDTDVLLNKLKFFSNTGKLMTKVTFKRMMYHLWASQESEEEEHVLDFLFSCFDVNKSGLLDCGYLANMLSYVWKGDVVSQLHFFYYLLDFDHDGILSTRDLCAIHDSSINSNIIKHDIRILLDIFNQKIENIMSQRRRPLFPFHASNNVNSSFHLSISNNKSSPSVGLSIEEFTEILMKPALGYQSLLIKLLIGELHSQANAKNSRQLSFSYNATDSALLSLRRANSLLA